MSEKKIRALGILIAVLLLLSGYGIYSGTNGSIFQDNAGSPTANIQTADDPAPQDTVSDVQDIVEDGEYSEYEEVAEYIHLYSHLPENYITKDEAAELGWVSDEGNLWDVTDQMCIGGDIFGNREGKLPEAKGRIWRECDVNYSGGFRNGERIVYSSDGLIYYTNDHYETFTKLY